MITLGLSQILVGTAAADGVMPASLTKIGATYKETCKLSQDASEVTEHFEEGKSSPMVRNKQKKMPVLKFQIMDATAQMLVDLVGGSLTAAAGWGFDGTEVVANKAIKAETSQGYDVLIPNGDIEATITADLSKKGLFLVDVTVTPMAVTANKAIEMRPKTTLVVAPTTLSFTAAADSTGQTITATSTGNVTSAKKDDAAEWLTVTRSGKVVTVKVVANTNSESRTANVTIVADGNTAIVPVTQAGA